LHFLIEMTRRSSRCGVQTTITMRPAKNPIVWIRVSGIVKAQILYGVALAGEHLSSFGKIEAPLLKGLRGLRWVKSDTQ
jgi:hypothetical protein